MKKTFQTFVMSMIDLTYYHFIGLNCCFIIRLEILDSAYHLRRYRNMKWPDSLHDIDLWQKSAQRKKMLHPE